MSRKINWRAVGWSIYAVGFVVAFGHSNAKFGGKYPNDPGFAALFSGALWPLYLSTELWRGRT